MRYLIGCVAFCLGLAGCCWGHHCDEGEPNWTPEPTGGVADTDGQSCD
ncbi:MAG: hypothetical protein HY828_17460, partial [Actinobacteria bacterium]|nr:hypothetical protein [Actinomycetota bacterium]